MAGDVILQNRYRTEGVLGIGDRARVYQARDMRYPDANRYVAIKEIRYLTKDAKLSQIAYQNAKREATILAGLNHLCIPTIHDFFLQKRASIWF